MKLPLKRIVSGGQTGVDRAALDVAIELGIHCEGTLIITRSEFTVGTEHTQRTWRRLFKPVAVVDPSADDAAKKVRVFIKSRRIAVVMWPNRANLGALKYIWKAGGFCALR